MWAQSVLERESELTNRRRQRVLTAAGVWPEDGYIYHGIIHPDYPDHELVAGVARSVPGAEVVERWAGDGWGDPEPPPEGLEYVLLDAETLADVLDSGGGGLILRPVQPRGWLPYPQDMAGPVLAAGPPPRHTGAMVALYPDPDVAASLVVPGGENVSDMHLTLAYLGDTEEESIDYDAVQAATARWARRFGPVLARINGTGQFHNDDGTCTVALVDSGELPAAREALVSALGAEGVEVKSDHGFTPHITLAWDERDVPLGPVDVVFDTVSVCYADDRVDYGLGEPVVAAGTSPDIVYAIVDEFDTAAVLDIIRVSPGPVTYVRKGGKWLKDEKLGLRLMGVDPPPVVEVQPELVRSVIDQVDAYDRENPDAVTAAFGMRAKWEEQKHKRGHGGKFAKKAGGAGPTSPAKARGGPRAGGGPRPARKRAGKPAEGRERRTPTMTRDEVRNKPWDLVRGKSDLEDLALGHDFWQKQPRGFKAWLQGWMQKKLKEERRGSNDSSSSKPDTRSQAEKARSRREAEKGREKGRAAARGGSSEPSWMSEVPPRFRGAMKQFMSAAEMSIRDAPRKRSEMVDYGAYDNKFDLDFAKEGMGESRRRDVFDRQLRGQRGRLMRAGLNPASVDNVMRTKIVAEKQRREAFNNQRRLRAEQERIRRMKTAQSGRTQPGIQAAGANPPATSRMPGGLQKYWLGPEGRAKIRWGTSGDFNRCRRALAKYLRPDQISGACANLHKLATGSWPGKQTKH